jgi:hypothetical protein
MKIEHRSGDAAPGEPMVKQFDHDDQPPSRLLVRRCLDQHRYGHLFDIPEGHHKLRG